MKGHRLIDGATLALVGALAVGGCANPAQPEIDRGSELLNTGRWDEAFTAYSAALELDPDNIEALTGRGCAAVHTDVTAAIADLDRAVASDPANAGAYRCRAEGSRSKGDLDSALADATKAVELDSADPSGHVTFANILDDMGRTSEAIPEYDKAIELASGEADVDGGRLLLANAHNQRSIARGRLGDDSGAAADVDKAIELDPEYGPAWANRAMTGFWSSNCERAIEDATVAIELEPDWPTAYSARALCLADAGQLDDALADADRAVQLDPAHMFVYYARGVIHAERGDNVEAAADLKRAIELAPSPGAADEIRGLMASYGLE